MALLILAAWLAQHFMPASFSTEAVWQLAVTFFGIFTAVLTIEAVRAGYFPGKTGVKGIYREQKPFQFWAAVLLFNVLAFICVLRGAFFYFGLGNG